jgi:ribonuclease D
MTFINTINNEEISKLPLHQYQGKILLIDDLSNLKKIEAKLKEDIIWGFDTESRPAFRAIDAPKRKPALLQLTNDNTTYLFRLNKIGLPQVIIDFLQNPDIIKIGLAINDDFNNLQKIKKITPGGFIDLQTIAKDFGITELGLKKMAAIVLAGRISKRQQTSNWEADVLTQKQKIYAATDAWITRQIYFKLQENDSTRL